MADGAGGTRIKQCSSVQSGKKREDGRVQMCVNVNHVCVKYQSYVMTLLYAAEDFKQQLPAEYAK